MSTNCLYLSENIINQIDISNIKINIQPLKDGIESFDHKIEKDQEGKRCFINSYDDVKFTYPENKVDAHVSAIIKLIVKISYPVECQDDIERIILDIAKVRFNNKNTYSDHFDIFLSYNNRLFFLQLFSGYEKGRYYINNSWVYGYDYYSTQYRYYSSISLNGYTAKL
jgi:hypothetical protein